MTTARREMCHEIKQKWLRRLVLPSLCAALLRLPFGVEPPCGFGSFLLAQKMRNVYTVLRNIVCTGRVFAMNDCGNVPAYTTKGEKQ